MKGYFNILEPVAKVISWVLAWFIAFFLWLGVPTFFFLYLRPLWCPFVAAVIYYVLLISIMIRVALWFEKKVSQRIGAP
jgi:hypothetical protein